MRPPLRPPLAQQVLAVALRERSLQSAHQFRDLEVRDGGAISAGRDRGQVAEAVGRRRGVPGRAASRPPEVLLSRDVPVPLGQAAHGPHAGLLHRRPAGALQDDARLQRAAPDGLGRVRPARRERRHGARDAPGALDAREHRQHEAADARPRGELRLGARDRDLRPRSTTAGTSGSSCGCTSAAWSTAAARR